MKILFLTNLLPYPLDNGGKIKTYTTLKALHENGHEINLVSFYENEDEKKSIQKIKEICLAVNTINLKLTTATNKEYMRKVALKSLFSKYSFGVYKYLNNKMIGLLQKIAREEKYDCVYFDHLQMCVYYDCLKKLYPNAKFILDEHNCESVIMQRRYMTTKKILMKIFLLLEVVKLKAFEKKMLSIFDEIIALTHEDESAMKKIANKIIPINVIPIGMENNRGVLYGKNNSTDMVKIMFVGTLSWEPNNDGIIWFLKNVFPKLKDKIGEFELYIVGKNPSDELKEIAGLYMNVFVTGYVESVVAYYEKCDYMIVPLFVGSGQRVKIIESFAYGMPVISTTIGAEGIDYTDGVNILIADDVETFIYACVEMKREDIRRKISINSKKTFEKSYSIKQCQKMIEYVLEKTLKV
ncbi:glycosyltransferase [Selenomonas ruminantium]|uniref:Glycosyl transferases group 1 n=1 Tax=Selenomonas ruminantium TaxID=971 RepID=A0A1H0VAD9_SELRU|nr:glycosyltransferase [Selenomonas ruminantium]SDP75387.1 Glycosyl transferases group 1 [Selenomonas ruminantium]